MNEVIKEANEAFKDWRNTSVTEKVEPLFKFVQVLKDEKEDVAKILTKEHSKSYDSALAELDRTI